MHYYEVAPTHIIRTNTFWLTYESTETLKIGQLVHIEVGKKIIIGVVMRKVHQPSYETKTIGSLIMPEALPYPLIELSLWLSKYYATHLATVLQSILPRGIEKKRREQPEKVREQLRDRTTIVFTPDQTQAVEKISSMTVGSALLHGVTGSGKTAVYIELTRRALANNKSVILLVPEIALTSQLVDEFTAVFKNVLLTHSRQTEAERHLSWQKALTFQLPQIIIGPRSALFMPVSNIGLIIIDECHEQTYKQEQSPRYSALRAASVLAKYHNAKLVLGSATPSVTDYYIAQNTNRPIITMSSRAQKDTVAADIKLVDMTKHVNFRKHRFLSDTLLSHLASTFDKGHQALVFHNRRGSASTTLCENCGWTALCPRCFVPLTLHGDLHKLMCHVCGKTDRVPTNCPECGSIDILHKGIGTKLIESELRKLFPDKIIARFDGDNEKGMSVEERYKEIYSGEIDLIIGTQVIAKGLDLPALRTVGVLQADAGLSLPDYSSAERTFQLLAQVVGRVGRSMHATTVVIQSYKPDHPAIQYGITQDYSNAYNYLLSERRKSHFPPFSYILKLICIYKTESAAIKNAKKLAQVLKENATSDVEVLGPAPAFYERQHDTYRWQLVLKSSSRTHLLETLQYLPSSHWQFEIDPTSLL
jgi:primosomal protein N' (replication factor Y) (superfamily II helicase)